MTIYNAENGCGIITFNVFDHGKLIFPQDMASFLSSKGIAVRSGQHCAKLMGDLIKAPGTVRASIYFYNTMEDIDRLVDALKEASFENTLDIFFLERGRMNMPIDPMLMREIIMDNYQYPHNKHLSEDPSYCSRHMASDSCIDDITVQAKFKDGKIEDVRFDGQACTISTASTSILTDLVKERPWKKQRILLITITG